MVECSGDDDGDMVVFVCRSSRFSATCNSRCRSLAKACILEIARAWIAGGKGSKSEQYRTSEMLKSSQSDVQRIVASSLADQAKRPRVMNTRLSNDIIEPSRLYPGTLSENGYKGSETWGNRYSDDDDSVEKAKYKSHRERDRGRKVKGIEKGREL